MNAAVLGSTPPDHSFTHPLRTLRGRLGLGLAVLLFVLLVTLSLALASFAQRHFVALAADSVEALAYQTARELAGGMDAAAREIQLQAANPRFRDRSASTAGMRAELEAIQRARPHFAYLSIIDMESATVLAATGGLFEGGSGRGRPVFEEGRKGLFLGDVHDAVRLAELLPKPANGDPLRFLDVSVPVLDAAGSPFRVLATHIGWEWADTVRTQVLRPVERQRRVEIMLADTQGKVVLASNALIRTGTDISALLGQGANARPVDWANGQPYLTSVVPALTQDSLPGFGWRVVVRQPMETVLQPSDQMRRWFLLGGLLLGTVGAWASWLLAGSVLRPVTALARSLRDGASDSVPGDSALPAEVADVRAVFRRVAGSAAERVRSSEERLRAMSDAVPQMLWVCDAQGRLDYANDRLLDHLGAVSAASLTWEALLARLHPDDAQRYGAGWADAVRRGAPFEVEARLAGADGAFRWHLHRALPHAGPEGRVERWFGAITDIDELKRAQLSLVEADRRKDEFIAMLSHELRNPLAPVANGVALLQRLPSVPAAAQRTLDMMGRQVAQLTRLVNDLMDVSRISHNKVQLRLEPVDLAAVCASAVEAVRPLVEERRHALQVRLAPGLPPVNGDAQRLAQMVSNLLGNAAKYTPEGGRIALEVTATPREVAIAVTDDGCGIEPTLLPQVFELFTQADQGMARQAGGLGIGLAVVKELAALHGGRVEAASAGAGQGSRFTLFLPAALEA